MGFQLNVEHADLVAAGIQSRHRDEDWQETDFEGFTETFYDDWTEYHIPGVGWVASSSDSGLWIDIRNVNHNVRAVLDELEVPYVRC